MNSKDFLVDFLAKYLGMIIGIIIAVLVLVFNLDEAIFKIGVIVFGAWLGKYIQSNDISIKEKLKNFIDKF